MTKSLKADRRPPAGVLRRREQLRQAKRAQRGRDREAGLVLCQVKLRPETAEKLRRAIAIAGFEDTLARFLDQSLVDVQAYPNLKLLCWNRAERFIPAADAFSLYERNWRFVDEKTLLPAERELIERLTQTHGAGLLNV
jgi:hypothetical protein